MFEASAHGLYYLDTAKAKANGNKQGVMLLETVTKNKTRYTNAEVQRAELARSIQCKIGRPSTREYIRLVTNNLLPNCPVTKRDIMAAEDIFGPDVGYLKGHTVRRNPPRINTDQVYTPLPPSVHERYKDVTLCADVMHVNGVPFFVSIS